MTCESKPSKVENDFYNLQEEIASEEKQTPPYTENQQESQSQDENSESAELNDAQKQNY